MNIAGLLEDWRPDWPVLALALVIGIGYLRGRRRLAASGAGWPRRRDVCCALGLVAMVWASSGFPNAAGRHLMWVWTSQQLLLLLIVPIIVLAGQPVALLRTTGSAAWLSGALASRPLRILGSPLLGPLLVPVICLVLFFGGLGQAALVHPWVGSVLAVGLLLVGSLIALPLIDSDDDRSSLAVGLALGVGFVELILDNFPGIALRFQTHLVMPYFGAARPAWAGGALDDQHTAGSILWVVAELLDLPFLILAATRWIRADAREAERIDAELDAHEVALPARSAQPGRPWWLDDPGLRDRYHGPGPG